MQSTERRPYDRGDIFSPDGRLYQVEYAREAVARGSPVVGVTAEDGVALAATVRSRSPLQDASDIEKLRTVDHHLALGAAGHAADARRLATVARERAQAERLRYDAPLDATTLASALADRVQEATQQAGIRPFGTALLVCGPGGDGEPDLHEVDPSGTPSGGGPQPSATAATPRSTSSSRNTRTRCRSTTPSRCPSRRSPPRPRNRRPPRSAR
jgi:proteasome alpha subunit